MLFGVMEKRKGYIFDVFTAFLGAVSIMAFIYIYRIGFMRFVDSVIDLFNSLGYYFVTILNVENHGIIPRVIDISDYLKNVSKSFLPMEWSEYTVLMGRFGEKLISGDNMLSYLMFIAASADLLTIVLTLIVLMYVLYRILKGRLIENENNLYGKESRALRAWKVVSEYTYRPLIQGIKEYSDYIRSERMRYIRIFTLIWLIALNVMPILLEVIAYVLYLACSFDVKSFFGEIYKLTLDLYVFWNMLPTFGKIVITLVVIVMVRQHIGYSRLQKREILNQRFISKCLGIATLICGAMGTKKTTLLVDITLSQEVIFRDKAFELMLDIDMEYPNFNWQLFENDLSEAMERHQVKNLATAEMWVYECLNEYIDHDHDVEYLWGYDTFVYRSVYNDGLKISNIYETLVDYAKLYFVYVIESSLVMSNLSIRQDDILRDKGNLPLWDHDFFRRNPKYADVYSRHSHIIDYDTVRLGKLVIDNNKNVGAFEFGVLVCTEIGKERLNAVELKEVKKTASEANQKNDLLNTWLKMCRHLSYIRHFPFVKVLFDEQRPESLGADARELCDKILWVDSTSDDRLAMPLYFIEEMIIYLVNKAFKRDYVDYRYNRADSTLSMYTAHNIASALYNYDKKITNTFGYYNLELSVEKGTRDGGTEKHRYTLSKKKTYSDRFASACYADYFRARTLKNNIGLVDMATYLETCASLEELKQQNSYFVKDILSNTENAA